MKSKSLMLHELELQLMKIIWGFLHIPSKRYIPGIIYPFQPCLIGTLINC